MLARRHASVLGGTLARRHAGVPPPHFSMLAR